MSEMIERVAAAIHKDSALEPGGPGILSLPTCRLIAVTAIEAMREPTTTMIEAEPPDDGEFNKGNSAAHARAFWQAMVDAALG